MTKKKMKKIALLFSIEHKAQDLFTMTCTIPVTSQMGMLEKKSKEVLRTHFSYICNKTLCRLYQDSCRKSPSHGNTFFWFLKNEKNHILDLAELLNLNYT